VRVCIDFRDLKWACLKNDFLLPHIGVLIDNTTGYEILLFMDGFLRFNKIKLVEEDQEKTYFTTLWRVYGCMAMSFGLKNVGATYSRDMMVIFLDMIHIGMEVYGDDILVKFRT